MIAGRELIYANSAIASNDKLSHLVILLKPEIS